MVVVANEPDTFEILNGRELNWSLQLIETSKLADGVTITVPVKPVPLIDIFWGTDEKLIIQFKKLGNEVTLLVIVPANDIKVLKISVMVKIFFTVYY
jgi:hypothetical protein